MSRGVSISAERARCYARVLLYQAAAFLFFLCSQPVWAEDWPRFLGPHADGTSSETNLIDSIPASGAKVVWDLEIGTGYGAPSVRGGRLVLHHRKADEEIVREIDAKTG